ITMYGHSSLRGVANTVAELKKLSAENYIMVTLDIDTTGRRLSDEILQLAAYTPTSRFEQYIMPNAKLNAAARLRHQVHIITIKATRMLKSIRTNKIIKTESEHAVLENFLHWLSTLELKYSRSNGIILLYHEQHHFIPHMLLQALQKYDMLEEFAGLITCFLNGSSLAKTYLGGSDRKYLSLSKLSLLLSKTKAQATNVDKSIGSASVRAKMAFHMVLQLMNRDRKIESHSLEGITNLYSLLKPYSETIEQHLVKLDAEVQILRRENTLRPLFAGYSETAFNRVRANKFRLILAESGFDLRTLHNIWRDTRIDGLTAALRAVAGFTTKQKTEVVELMDCYYDPSKIVIKPPLKFTRIRLRKRLAAK
ncbi:hypothetical protein KR222_000816, partial [Zaprionus bogoriensis]